METADWASAEARLYQRSRRGVEAAPESRGAAVAGVADVCGSGRGVGDTADRDHEPAARQLLEEAPPGIDFDAGRAPVRGLRARMRGHGIPAERLLLELQLLEDGADDRRGRLGGARPGELALGREGHAAHAGAAVARRFADQQEAGVFVRRQIIPESTPQQAGARAFTIEVERGADLRSGQLLDKAHGSHSDGRRATAARDRTRDRRLAR